MNQKILFLTISLLIFSLAQATSQSVATQKGAHIINGMVSFTSQGGDLYSGGFSDNRISTFMISPSYLSFVEDKIGIGGNLSYTRTSQGDINIFSFGIGPQFGYYFDNVSNTIPFIETNINYLSIGGNGNNEGGFGLKLGGGLVVRMGHAGFSFEAGYLRESFKPNGATSAVTGSTFFMGAGLVAFLYND